MGLYAIGDLHLHFRSKCPELWQKTDPNWKDREIVFRRNCQRLLTEEDTLVLVGDHSWGKTLFRSRKDLKFIAEEYGAEQVLYAHCHGEANFHNSIEGPFRSIKYTLVSGDCLRWSPHKVLD